MKKILTILTLFAALTLLSSSCQKELPDDLKDINVNQGGNQKDPTPTPENPSQQNDIPSESDNPMPSF